MFQRENEEEIPHRQLERPLNKSQKNKYSRILPCQEHTGQRKKKFFLNSYILEAGGVPTTRVNPFWNECANKLKKYCGSSCTGVMCCSRYQKVKNLFPVGATQEMQTDTFSLTKETQTDPALPVIEKQSSSHYWSFIVIPQSTMEQQSGAEKLIDDVLIKGLLLGIFQTKTEQNYCTVCYILMQPQLLKQC